LPRINDEGADKMKKFILIDHSIQKYGGHNLEYALHVLRAAEKQNYKPILVTNRELVLDKEDQELKGIEVHPLYLFDFWGHAGKPRKKSSKLKRLKAGISNWFFRRKVSFAYSNLGMLLAMEHRYEEYLRNTPYQARNVVVKLILIFPIIYIITLLRGLKKTLKSLKHLFSGTFIGTFVNLVKNILLSFRYVIRGLFSPIIFANRHKKKIVSRLRKTKRIKSFGNDTLSMLKKVSISHEDIVFIPTLSEYDMLGLLEALKKNKSAQQASWHLLFRRNLFTGRDPQYSKQTEHLQPLRKMFLHFKNNTWNFKTMFYTDTDKLTDQYHHLKTVPFATLPIPINVEFQTKQREYDPSQPIKIVYVGDARNEKGYQYLPEMVRGLYSPYIKDSKVKFIAQSNFSFSEYQYHADVVVARNQLEQFSQGVEIIKDSLSTSAYRELVLASDIGLILYDRDNYYARSSGALVEYLSAGIPVVVPSGSWMADQICDLTYEYHDHLRSEGQLLFAVQAEYYKWSNSQDNDFPFVRGQLNFGSHTDSVWCTFVPPEDTEYVMVSFKFVSASKGNYVTLQLSEHNHTGSVVSQQQSTVGRSMRGLETSVLFKIKNLHCEEMALSLHNAYGNHNIAIIDVKFHYLKDHTNTGQGIPKGSVGIIVDDTTHAIEALKEMVDHYPHYRKTAKQYSVSWNKTHSADALISDLIPRGTPI
jgi:hypothetical protein